MIDRVANGLFINDQLFGSLPSIEKARSLQYAKIRDAVGIAYDGSDCSKPFVAYMNDEHGNVEYTERYTDLGEAVGFAQGMYSDLMEMYEDLKQRAIAKNAGRAIADSKMKKALEDYLQNGAVTFKPSDDRAAANVRKHRNRVLICKNKSDAPHFYVTLKNSARVGRDIVNIVLDNSASMDNGTVIQTKQLVALLNEKEKLKG